MVSVIRRTARTLPLYEWSAKRCKAVTLPLSAHLALCLPGWERYGFMLFRSNDTTGQVRSVRRQFGLPMTEKRVPSPYPLQEEPRSILL